MHRSTHTLQPASSDRVFFIKIRQISQVLGGSEYMVHNSEKVNHKGSSVGLMYFS